MGAKNRQGCCCGGTSASCYGGCTVCEGVFLKNGVVHDASGDHPLLQPKPSAGLPWRTAPIKFTTGYWTDGDCVAKTGDAWYVYQLFCNPEDSGDGGSVTLRVYYSITQCPAGVWLYDGDQPDTTDAASSLSSAKTNAQIQCDPFEAAFDLGEAHGLLAPWAGATVTFDRDDAAQRKCECRKGLLPDGDVIASYNINDVDGKPRSGSVWLYMDRHVDGYAWRGTVDWWDRPSCTNPTNAPGIDNVYMTGANGSVFSFLKWCLPDNTNTLTYHTAPTGTPVAGDIRFNLMNGHVKEGSVRIKDAPGAVLGDNVCCDPCDIPRKSMHVTYFITTDPNPVPDNCPLQIGVPLGGTVFDLDLAYSAAPTFVQGTTFDGLPSIAFDAHWKAKVSVSGPIGGMWNGDYMVYLGCWLVAAAKFSPSTPDVEPTSGPILNSVLDQSGWTCDPPHMGWSQSTVGTYCAGTSPIGLPIFGNYTMTSTLYVDGVD